MTNLCEFLNVMFSLGDTSHRTTLLAGGCCLGLLLGASSAIADLKEPNETAVSDTRPVVTGPATAGIYRSTGTNGEVEFNDFGDGVPVALNAPAAPAGADLKRSVGRVEDILLAAQALAADRQARTSARRDSRLEARAAAARREARSAQQDDYYASNRRGFFPGFLAGGGVRARQKRRPGVGPYRDGYRYGSGQGGQQPGSSRGARPAPGPGSAVPNNNTGSTFKRSL